MSETNKTESDLNKSLKKAESVVNKLDVNVSINQIKESGTVEQIQSIKKDASNIDTLTNKPLKSNENSSSDQIKKVKSNVPETIKNVTKDSSKFISNVKKADITKSITKIKKPKNIVVDNIIPSQMIPQNQEGGKTKVIVLGKSLNSMVKENILLDAAYT